MELDEVYSSYSKDRQALIDNIKSAGKNYNFDKYSTEQLYRMWQRIRLETATKKYVPIKEPKHEFDLDFEDKYKYCGCGTLLNDAGFCPVCYYGEEDLDEDIFDTKPVSMSSWVTSSGQPVKIPGSSTSAAATSAIPSTSNQSSANNKFVVKIVSDKGRLRAQATDGIHPGAWVAFPNDLRQFEGQKYEVDQLIWNGKNYRVAGNIIEI